MLEKNFFYSGFELKIQKSLLKQLKLKKKMYFVTQTPKYYCILIYLISVVRAHNTTRRWSTDWGNSFNKTPHKAFWMSSACQTWNFFYIKSILLARQIQFL